MGCRMPRTEWRRSHLRSGVCRAVQLHRRLLTQEPPRGLDSFSKVLLVEGRLGREDMRFLECLARVVHCPYELRYKELPAAVTQGEQLVAGTERE